MPRRGSYTKGGGEGGAVMIAFTIICFALGIGLVISGFQDLSSPLGPPSFMSLINAAENGSVGGLKVIVGVIFVVLAVAPEVLKVKINLPRRRS